MAPGVSTKQTSQESVRKKSSIDVAACVDRIEELSIFMNILGKSLYHSTSYNLCCDEFDANWEGEKGENERNSRVDLLHMVLEHLVVQLWASSVTINLH